MKDNLRIYGVKDSYIKYLSQYQEHLFLHEGVDFIKIKDYAVININNMIPVPKGQLVERNINAEKVKSFSSRNK